MSHTLVQINGINVISQENGDIRVILHPDDLLHSLSTLSPLNNGTYVLLAAKRSSLSAKGHSHNKPTYKVWPNQEQEKSSM